MDVIKVITGLRRSGKSVIMRLVQDTLIRNGIQKNQIIYYNFESFIHEELLDAKKLYQAIIKQAQLADGNTYIFLDEIQNVRDWQRCINALQVDLRSDIYLTGSNANLLSGELATYIAGRFVEIKVTPFSFSEFVECSKERGYADSIPKLFQEYVQYGGMPFVCYLDDKSKFQEYMAGIYSSVLLNDIITRHKIRSTEGLERILRYAIEGKELLKTQDKYYVCDHGFKEYLYGDNQRDIELVLENIVYMEMQRRGYQVSVGSILNKEIDFICQKGGTRLYLQVTYMMASPESRTREFAPLLAIHDNFPKYILSMDEFDFSDAGILHRNIRDFLLEQKK